MDRRRWFRNAALIATGAVAADQLDLLERLTWKRRLWPGADLRPIYTRFKVERHKGISVGGSILVDGFVTGRLNEEQRQQLLRLTQDHHICDGVTSTTLAIWEERELRYA